EQSPVLVQQVQEVEDIHLERECVPVAGRRSSAPGTDPAAMGGAGGGAGPESHRGDEAAHEKVMKGWRGDDGMKQGGRGASGSTGGLDAPRSFFRTAARSPRRSGHRRDRRRQSSRSTVWPWLA